MDPVTTAALTHTPTYSDVPENEPVQGATTNLDNLPELNSYTTPEAVEILRQIHEHNRVSGTVMLAETAKADGASVEWFTRDLAIAQKEGEQHVFSSHRGPATPIGVSLVKDKLATKQLLEKAGVATPRGKQVSNTEEAIAFQAQINAPIAVKPRSGNTGLGVSVNLTNTTDISEAFTIASKYGSVIVEESIQRSAEYRCMATDAECVSVTERILPTVVGDGTSTIDELITAKNEARHFVISTHKRPIPQDAATSRTLAQQNLSLDSVLEAGKRVVVRDVGGLSSGGEPYEKTNQVSDVIKNLAVRATAAIPGLHWGGSDIIVDENGQGYVIEINTSAAISGPAFPLYGQPVDLAGILWRLLQAKTVSLPKTKPARRRLLPPQVSGSLNSDQPAALSQAFLTHL